MTTVSHETAITEHVSKLSNVDSCLSELYARAIEQEGAIPTAKAVMLNLVIYAADSTHADRAAAQAVRILSSISCRVIIADLSAAEPQGGASLSMVCGVSERGDKRLCGEVIRLYTPPGLVTGSVMPLLIPDVPVYLWVNGPVPPEREDFADLLRVASHVIVDSRIGSETAKTLKVTQRLCQQEQQRRIVQDLAWISIQTWREAIAQHFDPPAARRYLPEINEVSIRYGGSTMDAAPAPAPLLLAAWLMQRTQMRATGVFRSKDEGFRIDAVQIDRPAIVRLIPVGSDAGTGMVESVVINCGNSEDKAEFRTELMDAGLVLTEDCRDVCLPPKRIDLPESDDATLAAVALKTYRRDVVFCRSLEVALILLGQTELADERSAKIRL